ADLLGYARQLLNEVAAKRGAWAPTIRGLAALADLENDPKEALRRFAQAFDLGDRDPDALRRAIQLMYDHQQYDDADKLLKDLEKKGKLPAELLTMQAALQSQHGQHDLAIANAQKVIDEGSKQAQDYIWLGQILFAGGSKHYERAEKAFRQAT